ncbi:MAG: tetratricopeptide repeat protein [Lachnospiraceae bacterium]|nr:tetratricopeptide repeat protein [Lachnospiraceae bacterium]
MDKYEFNIKVEQIKKLVSRGDYDTAMKIADTIDWHRVRNASLLSMIAQIYEKNEEYQEAKDILLLAFERAPIGKRLLYKLADLAVKEGSIAEAEAYYREFCDLAQDDPRQYLLRYQILKAKKAPADQLIRALETYTEAEMDEKWLYELAKLYHEAGKAELCVSTCDRIMLLFGLGKYVDKAMDLKLEYAPLSKYQMDLVENRDKYEANLRATQEEYNAGVPVYQEQEEYEEEREHSSRSDLDMQKEIVMRLHEDAQSQELAREMSRMVGGDARTAEVEEDESGFDATRTLDDLRMIKDIKPTRRVLDAAAEREAAEQEAREAQRRAIEEEVARRVEEEREIERQKNAIRAAKEREEMEEEALRRAEKEREAARLAEEERRARRQADIDRERALNSRVRTIAASDYESDDPELGTLPISVNNLMIEADTPEEGLETALGALKEIHRALGYKNQVAKINSEKLNKRGISQIAARLSGKDLVIENAADLSGAVQNELDELMEKDQSGMLVVLIDTPAHLDELCQYNMSLTGKFRRIGIDPGRKAQKAAETAAEEALKKETADQERILRETAGLVQEAAAKRPVPEPVMEEAQPEPVVEAAEMPRPVRIKEKSNAIPNEGSIQRVPIYEDREMQEPEVSEEPAEEPAEPKKTLPEGYEDGREMDLDEFAQYACKYASEIDCSITGKSLLALYERIEMMEEEDVPLTKTAAIDLIEAAADKAERPSIGRKLTGIFSPKYDKEGFLILHENDFFD